VLPPEGEAALTSGEVPPRAVALLSHLLERHELRLRTLDADGFEVAAVDGEPVSDLSFAARELVDELAGLGPDVRPSAIYAPWAIDAPEFAETAPDRIVILFEQTEAPGGRASAVFDTVEPGEPGAGTLTLATPADQPPAEAPPEPKPEPVHVDEAPAPAAGGDGVAALLADPRLTLPDPARADFESGHVDPRLVAVLHRLLEKHEVGLSVVITGHDQLTSTGSVSNHFHGRGLDIATVDDEPVSPSSEAAKQLGQELADLDPALRPTEVGAPWPFEPEGFFTDDAHLNHIHVAYDDPPPAGYVVPAPTPVEETSETSEAVRDDGGRASAVFGAVSPAGGGSAQGTLGVTPAVPEPADVVEPELQPPPAGGTVAPIAPEDLTNVPEGEHLHGSEFAVPDAEGADGPTGSLHAGYDMFARPDAPVRSPIAGTIVEVRESETASGQIFGGVVKVQGADGQVWVFRHVEPVAVTEGMTVEAGRLVATVTPWTDGSPHAHIELWKTLEGGYYVPNMRDPLEELQHAYAPGAPVVDAEHGAEAEHQHEHGDEAAVDGETPAEEGTAEQPAGEGRASAVFETVAPTEGPPPVRSTVQFLPTVQPEEPEAPPGEPAPEPEPVLANAGDLFPYPGDDAPREAIAAWMARNAEQVGIPGELPVMASLVESNMKNLSYGDADSVGFFQMRLSIWNQGAYAGYAENPELQLRWFLDGAVALKEQRLAEGVTDFGADDGTWGEWIADVERPAEQYRYRYQEKLEEARWLLR
jgi:murein DD-endopeptidase MepM/ murein hydrolase activator NlpD